MNEGAVEPRSTRLHFRMAGRVLTFMRNPTGMTASYGLALLVTWTSSPKRNGAENKDPRYERAVVAASSFLYNRLPFVGF